MKPVSIRWTTDQLEAIKTLRSEGISLGALIRRLFDEWVIARDDLVSPTERKLAVLRQVDRINSELQKLEGDKNYLAVLRTQPELGEDSSSLLDKVTELYYLAEDENSTVGVSRHNLGVLLKYKDYELLVKQSHRDGGWTFDSWIVIVRAQATGCLKDEHIDRLIDIAATSSTRSSDPYQIKRTEIIGDKIEELKTRRSTLTKILFT